MEILLSNLEFCFSQHSISLHEVKYRRVRNWPQHMPVGTIDLLVAKSFWYAHSYSQPKKTVYNSSGAGIDLFIGFNRREFLLFKQREYWGWETDPSTFLPFNRRQERCWSFSQREQIGFIVCPILIDL